LATCSFVAVVDDGVWELWFA